MKIACEVCETVIDEANLEGSSMIWLRLEQIGGMRRAARFPDAPMPYALRVCGTDCLRMWADHIDGAELTVRSANG